MVNYTGIITSIGGGNTLIEDIADAGRRSGLTPFSIKGAKFAGKVSFLAGWISVLNGAEPGLIGTAAREAMR